MVTQEVSLQDKQELTSPEERTQAGKFYVPYTDIHESPKAVVVTMDMPGVEKSAVDIRLENKILTITGNIDSTKYQELGPLYAEYNIGSFTRSFTLSAEIDGGAISAKMADGVLTLTLPKIKQAVAKQIKVA